MLNKHKLFLFGLCFAALTAYWLHSPLAEAADAAEKGEDAVMAAPASDGDEANTDKSSRLVSSIGEYNPEPEVNFNYFLTSGYAANDVTNIPFIGKVTGTPEVDGSLSTAKTVYVVTSSDKVQLDPGEKLIVFGDVGPIHVKKADFNKRFIKNFAILRVREAMGRRYLADVVTSYEYIPAGSPVKLYSGEKTLWDKAQVAKELPARSIKCYVAGGERGREEWHQTDYLILTAGSKQGVVEGLSFELWETRMNKNGKTEGVSRGFAKVFYAGSNYCLAQIQSGSDSISSGFEALYKP